MPGCNHNHHNSEKESDYWTKIATAGEYVASFVSDAYWLGTMLDTMVGFEEESSGALGLSYYGLSFGVTLALLSAGGASYSHMALNTLHQEAVSTLPSAGEFCCQDSLSTMEYCGQSSYPPISSQEVQKQPLLEDNLNKNIGLAWYQNLALVGDYISHVGDVAGPLIFVSELATRNQDSPQWQKITVQCAATLFGGVSSVAGVRTCRNSMLAQVQQLPCKS